MSRWIRDARSLVDLALIMVAFVLLGGIMHLVTGRIVSATIAGANAPAGQPHPVASNNANFDQH